MVSIYQKNQKTKNKSNQIPPKDTETKDWSVYIVTWKINIFIFLPTLFHFFQIKFKSVQSILLQYIFCKNQCLKESQYFNKQYSRPR